MTPKTQITRDFTIKYYVLMISYSLKFITTILDYFPNRRCRFTYSSITERRSSLLISGHNLLTKNNSVYESCHNRKLDNLCSPEVRISISGSKVKVRIKYRSRNKTSIKHDSVHLVYRGSVIATQKDSQIYHLDISSRLIHLVPFLDTPPRFLA